MAFDCPKVNKTKARLKAGLSCYGVVARFAADEVVEMAGVAGCDFVIVDMEHEALDLRDAARLIRTAALMDMTPIVRLGQSWLHAVDPLLAAGAQGFSLSRVRSCADIDAIVERAFYYPLGKRTVYALGASGNYGHEIDEAQWAERVNPQIMIQAIVEEKDAVENIDELIAHPLLDVIECGAKDLRQSMGMVSMATATTEVSKVFAKAAMGGKATAHSISGHIANAELYKPIAAGVGAMFVATPAGILMSSLASMVSTFKKTIAS